MLRSYILQSIAVFFRRFICVFTNNSDFSGGSKIISHTSKNKQHILISNLSANTAMQLVTPGLGLRTTSKRWWQLIFITFLSHCCIWLEWIALLDQFYYLGLHTKTLQNWLIFITSNLKPITRRPSFSITGAFLVISRISPLLSQ